MHARAWKPWCLSFAAVGWSFLNLVEIAETALRPSRSPQRRLVCFFLNYAEGLQSRLLLQVHDELVFEVPPDEQQAMRALIEEEMVNALPLDVPIEVDVNTGDNWLDAH